MKRLWIVFVLAAFVSFGCAHRATVKPEAEQQKEQKTEEMKAQQPSETAEAQKEAGMEKEEVERAETAGQEGVFSDIHFDFDRYNIQDADRSELKKIAAWMRENTSAKLSVEGHCDERGTNEYNLALGDRRAKSVRDYLMSLGVPSTRIETISYGEEKPLCSERTEECWAKNRRAHFVVMK